MSAKKISNRDIVLKKAMELFLSKGYSLTSMDEIVTQSKVSKTNIYYHFKNKEELLLSIVQHMISHYQRQAEHILKHQGLTILEKFERFVQLLGDEEESADPGCIGGCPFLTLYLQASHEVEQVRIVLQQFFEQQIAMAEALLTEGMEKGQIRSDLPVAQTASLIVSMIEGALFLRSASQKKNILQEVSFSLALLLK